MASKVVRDAERSLARQRKADFEVTNDVNAALFANLRKLVKGESKRMTRFNKKQYDKVSAAQQRAAANSRRAAGRFRKEQTGDFGGVLSGAFDAAAADIVTTGRALNKGNRGHVQASKQYAQGANDISTILKAGTQNIKAGADALAAEALSQRASADATTIAQMKFEERMMEREQAFQREMARKEFKRQSILMGVEEKKAQKELGATFGQMKPAVTAFASMVPEVLTFMSENPGSSPEEVLQMLQEKSLISAQDAQSPVVGRLLYNLMNNTRAGREDIVDEFIEGMSLHPAWSAMTAKHRQRLKSYIESALSTTVARYKAGDFSQASGGDDGPGFFGINMRNPI